MSKGLISISGFSEKEPRENKDGSISIIFKIPHFNETDLNYQENYCLVTIDKARYGKIKEKISENTFCYIEGSFKVGKNQKDIPFLTVKCSSIAASNLLRKQFVSDNVKLTEEFPLGTDELMEISRIIINEKMLQPTVAKKRALNYIMKHGNFERPILLNRENLTIRDGYEYYLAAQELRIESVPVSYMQQYYKPGDLDYYESYKKWYIGEEITKVNVKDIMLVEDVHLKVKNFAFHLDLDHYRKDSDYFPPVALRPADGGKYALIMGAARYFAAKIMDVEEIPAVIKNMTHKEFTDYYRPKPPVPEKNEAKTQQPKEKKTRTVTTEEIDIRLISVPDMYINTPPRAEKIKESIDYYKKHGKFDKPIVVKGDNYVITDGYKRYVAAVELKLEKILATVIK